MTAPAKRLFLLDGMALVYRAHFAFIKNPRITSSGFNTSAIFGFATTLLDIIENQAPTHLAVAFDTPEPTPRHLKFPEYKGTREAMPEDLCKALPEVDKLLAACRIPVLRVPGFEADDVIGTLARRAEREGFETYMVTPDKDFAQLVDAHTFLYKPARAGTGAEVLGVPEILKQWEVQRVEQVVDVLGLMGDTSDNVPGILGVGEKTAKKLVAQFGSVEQLLARSGEVTGKLRETVERQAEMARLSKWLVTIITDVPVGVTLDGLARAEPDREQLATLFAGWEFRTLGQRVLGLAPGGGGGAPPPDTDLFGQALPARRVPAAPAAPSAPLVVAEEGDEPGEEGAGDAVAAAAEPGVDVAGLKTIRDLQVDYQLVDTPEQRAALRAALAAQPAFCFDLESTSLDPRRAECVGVAFSWEVGKGFFLWCPPDRAAAQAVLDEFRPIFTDPRSEKVGHNLKYDLSVLRQYGIRVAGPLYDTMIAHSLGAPEMRHGMDYLAQVCLGYNPIPIEALIGDGKDAPQRTMRDVPVPQVVEYAVEDADVTWQLRAVTKKLLAETNAERAYWEVEAPLIPVLVEMEYEGIRIDSDALREYSAQLTGELATLELRLYQQAGLHFNLDSPKQLGEVLFDRLKLDPNAKRTRKSGQYATSEQVLQRLAAQHPLVAGVLDFRQMRKLKSVYVDMLPTCVDARTGRVHTTFNQVVAATGRLASNDPNLQAIPVRSERGREVRKAFVPRGPEFALLSADYSQIELRLIAAISNDAAMRAAFDAGLDIHQATAARIYHVDLAAVTPEMRRKAKMVNFGIPYGISAFGLAQRLNIGRPEAGGIIDEYFRQFPAIKDYIDRIVKFARDHGFVETLMGRRRYLRDINSRNDTMRGAAERNAINSPIQGSAADLIKLAMIRIHRRLLDGGYRTRLLLQVHDELLFDLHRDEEAVLKPLLEQDMREAMPLPVPVPIVVDLGVGANWLEAH